MVGVSTDTVEAQRKFAESHRLNFILLADPEAEATGSYDVKMAGIRIAKRVTFLIDRGGTIRKVWAPASTGGHGEQVLAAAKELGLVADAQGSM